MNVNGIFDNFEIKFVCCVVGEFVFDVVVCYLNVEVFFVVVVFGCCFFVCISIVFLNYWCMIKFIVLDDECFVE